MPGDGGGSVLRRGAIVPAVGISPDVGVGGVAGAALAAVGGPGGGGGSVVSGTVGIGVVVVAAERVDVVARLLFAALGMRPSEALEPNSIEKL